MTSEEIESAIESAAAEAGTDPRKRALAISALAPVLMAIPNPVEARLWVERVAQAFEIHDLEAVRRQLRIGAAATKRPAERPFEQCEAPPSRARHALPDLAARCESPIELAFLDGIAVFSPDGERLFNVPCTIGVGAQEEIGDFRVDFTLRLFAGRDRSERARVVVECDGYHYHETPARAAADRARDRVLQSLGWIVLRFLGRELRQDPVECARQALQVLVDRSGPTQPRTVVPWPWEEPASDPPQSAEQQPSPSFPEIEKDVVGALLDVPALLGSELGISAASLLTSDCLQRVAREAARAVGSSGVIDAAALVAKAGAEANEWLAERLGAPAFDAEGAESFLKSAVPHLRQRRVNCELRALAPLIKQALIRGDSDRAAELMRRRDELYRIGSEGAR